MNEADNTECAEAWGRVLQSNPDIRALVAEAGAEDRRLMLRIFALGWALNGEATLADRKATEAIVAKERSQRSLDETLGGFLHLSGYR